MTGEEVGNNTYTLTCTRGAVYSRDPLYVVHYTHTINYMYAVSSTMNRARHLKDNNGSVKNAYKLKEYTHSPSGVYNPTTLQHCGITNTKNTFVEGNLHEEQT